MGNGICKGPEERRILEGSTAGAERVRGGSKGQDHTCLRSGHGPGAAKTPEEADGWSGGQLRKLALGAT